MIDGVARTLQTHRLKSMRHDIGSMDAAETDFAGGAVRDNKQVSAFIASVTALGRPGLPDDIGPAVAALLSEDNRWINAQRIEVSGGMFV